jgi:hypothetical protein
MMRRHPSPLRPVLLAGTKRRDAKFLCRSANAKWRPADGFIRQERNESAQFTQLALNRRNPFYEPELVIPGRTLPPTIFSLPY